jgi:hypothetical protein
MLALRESAKQSLNYRLTPRFLLGPRVKIRVDRVNFSTSKYVESCMELITEVE